MHVHDICLYMAEIVGSCRRPTQHLCMSQLYIYGDPLLCPLWSLVVCCVEEPSWWHSFSLHCIFGNADFAACVHKLLIRTLLACIFSWCHLGAEADTQVSEARPWSDSRFACSSDLICFHPMYLSLLWRKRIPRRQWCTSSMKRKEAWADVCAVCIHCYNVV